MVTPVSGGVRVPTGPDPALQVQTQMFNSLSSRLNQFQATANKMASAQAETQGLAYGARNAPTAAEVELAMQTGQPIELPGDASSYNVFQQAAYKGSLAVTEDRMDIAGRRYLTQMFAKAAADPEMDPSTLTAKLDSAVSEFASSLSAISPQSGAKVGKSLGILANSQVVQFTREYMARQTKLNKSNAISAGSSLIANSPNIVSGYNPEQGAATLQDRIIAGRVRLNSALQNGGVDPQTILKYERKYDDAISEAQINAIRNWAQTSPAYADDPLLAFQELRKFASGKKRHGVPPRLQEMWKMMDETERTKSIDGVMNLIKTYNQAEELADKKANNDAAAAFERLRATVPQLVAENNRDELAKVVTQYNALGHYDEAKELQEFLDRNETTLTSDLQDLTKLRDLRAVRILNYGDVAKAKLTEEDKAKFLEEINTQRDANVQAALRNAKTQLNVSEDDLENKLDQLPDYKKLQRVYYDQIEDAVFRERDRFVRTLRAKIRNGEERTAEDFFDAESLVRELLVDIQTKEKTRQISVQDRIVETAFKDLTRTMAEPPEMNRAFFNAIVAEDSGAGKADKAAAKRALQALKLIDEINRRP